MGFRRIITCWCSVTFAHSVALQLKHTGKCDPICLDQRCVCLCMCMCMYVSPFARQFLVFVYLSLHDRSRYTHDELAPAQHMCATQCLSMIIFPVFMLKHYHAAALLANDAVFICIRSETMLLSPWGSAPLPLASAVLLQAVRNTWLRRFDRPRSD